MRNRRVSSTDRSDDDNNEDLETTSLIRDDRRMSAPDVETDEHRFYPAPVVSLSVEADGAPAAVAAVPSVPVLPYWRTRDLKELLACVVFFVLCILSSVIDKAANERPIPFQLLDTGEYVRNLSFNESYDGETISDQLLIFLAILLPLVIQFTIGKLLGRKADAHATICIYFVAFGLTLMTTDLVKAYCGYLRPIFYDVCEPDENYEACTQTSDEAGVRRSFPSGHASSSFCGLTLLTLFLHTRFGVPSLREQQYAGQTNSAAPPSASSKDPMLCRFISILSLIPMGLALFIAASRVADNKHFPADVVAGSVLGASIANFVHGLWL